ncbi:MAG: ribonuclease Z [Candidatus Thorarchaeota archaeon]
MEVLFLGVGEACDPAEPNTSLLLKDIGSQKTLLLDCGFSTPHQYFKIVAEVEELEAVWISHFHGDHFLGLSGMIQTMNLNDRTYDLEIYGPKGTIKTVTSLLNLGYFSPGFKIIIHDLKEDEIVKFDKYDIKAFPVEHGIPAFGYSLLEHARAGKFNLKKAKKLGIPPGPLYRKLQSGKTIALKGQKIKPESVLGPPRPGRKIVYSGDTKPCPAMIKNASQADVLIHDACLDSELEEKAANYGHSTAAQAAEIAKAAKVKVLFLIHHSPRYKDLSILENEAKKIFRMSLSATDFLEYVVKYPKQ